MKKSLKIISIILIMGLIICGCSDDNVVDEEKDPKTIEKEKLAEKAKKIETSEVDFFSGEFSDKTIVLEAKNNNNEPVYANYTFEVYDKNKVKMFNKEVFVRIGSNSSAYVVAIQDLEEDAFDSYTYKVTILKDKLEDFDKIKKSIVADYVDNGKNIVVSFKNNGNRTTTVYGWLFFYKDNKMVAVKEVVSYNLTPLKEEKITINYPIKTVTKKISFDKVKLITNEVSTEL